MFDVLPYGYENAIVFLNIFSTGCYWLTANLSRVEKTDASFGQNVSTLYFVAGII